MRSRAKMLSRNVFSRGGPLVVVRRLALRAQAPNITRRGERARRLAKRRSIALPDADLAWLSEDTPEFRDYTMR